MEDKLQLVLAQDIEELTPKLIAFNNTELMNRVEEMLKAYENVNYTDEQISDAKKDRALLNSFCTALNNERLNIGKIYQAPYDKFKKQVDEVIAKVKTVSSVIDERIKEAEIRRQTEKQARIEEYFNEHIGEFKEYITFDKVLQSKWLNASVSMTAVKKEIDAFLENVKNALIAINALDSQDVDYIKLFYFKTLDLSSAISENARLQKIREDAEKIKQEREAKEKEIAKTEEQRQDVQEQTQSIEQKAEYKPFEVYTVRFSATGTKEQLIALKQFLKDNEIIFNAI